MTCSRLQPREHIPVGLGKEASDTSHLTDVESEVKGVQDLTVLQ